MRRILLADDHPLTRMGLRLLLEQMEDVRVVAEATNGREALALAREHKPDIVVMDVGMPDLNGIEATSRIIAAVPGTRVIILSAFTDEDHVLGALRAGASAYLVKSSETEELGQAIRAVSRGGTFLSAAVAGAVVSRSLGEVGGAEPDNPLGRLTPRQREILQMIAEGKSTKEVSYDLGVSVKTVETHRTQLMERIGIHDVASLVRFAVRNGVISA